MIGISTASFFNKVATEVAFDVLRSLEVGVTEVFLNTYSEYAESFVVPLAKNKGNINVHSIHSLGLQFEPELFSISERVRQDSEKVFDMVCNAGKVLGAKYYTFHGPAKLKNQRYTLDFAKFGQNINKITARAANFGIKISYENVHWCHFNEPAFFDNLRKECPDLYATLDVKQALQGGIDPLEFLDAMDGRISTVHLCDLDKHGNTCLPGKGTYDFGKLFRELKRRKINATMLLEVYSKDYNDISDLKNIVKWLQGEIRI
ncbi:MAG: sugar phosphate isomerase/epimerase [Firmicutes bacterium]|nr:sugar phosphate isomerase/epimerase [Bacillota bacterium]